MDAPDSVLENKYIQSLSTKERQAFDIAKSHLGTSFSVYKSAGFHEWKKEFTKQQESTANASTIE